MKQINHILLLMLMAFSFFACQKDDMGGESVGYLRLNVGESTSTNSRSIVPEDYQPKQIAVQILNSSNQVVEETEDWELWKEKAIALKPGVYTIKATSNGFDGQAADFDIPYYAGSETVTIENGKEAQKTVVCTLANVKVTVKFDENFVSKFKSMTVQVGDVEGKYTPLNFTTSEIRSAYFPVVSLFSKISVTNNNGVTNSLKKEFTDVKARDHYILNYKLAEAGSSNITVTVDPTTHEYTYTFTVSPEAVNRTTLSAGVWDRLAYLKAESVSAESGTSLEGLKFQFRAKASGEDSPWTDVSATEKEGTYTGFATGLTASTEYEYRLVNKDEVVIGAAQSFTTAATDAQTALYNGNFDLWSESGSTIYPGSAEEAGNTTSFWNTSNPGTTQGLGAIGGAVNPTTGVQSPVHTTGEGAYAAKLQTTNKLGVLAAASLYTGSFMGLSGMSANMEFGKPFTSRPVALRGYYMYTPQVINRVSRVPEGVEIVKDETMDQCAIFIALAKKSFTFNNNKEEEYIDYEGDDNIIAYGELPSGAATSGDGYTEFTIPLKYKESQFGEQPTHIIIVCSASKYGDYMTGGDNSLLYVDDFSLVYEGTPTIWENK